MLKKFFKTAAISHNFYPIISCEYNTKWQIETVDGENGSVGKFTSIALDANGNPHISYYDESNEDLKYWVFSKSCT